MMEERCGRLLASALLRRSHGAWATWVGAVAKINARDARYAELGGLAVAAQKIVHRVQSRRLGRRFAAWRLAVAASEREAAERAAAFAARQAAVERLEVWRERA